MDRGKLLIDSSKNDRVINKHRELQKKGLVGIVGLYSMAVVFLLFEIFIWPVILFPATVALYAVINFNYVQVYENGFTSANNYWGKEVFILWSNIETITKYDINRDYGPDVFFIIGLKNKVPGISKKFYLGADQSSFADSQEFEIIASKHVYIIDGNNKV